METICTETKTDGVNTVVTAEPTPTTTTTTDVEMKEAEVKAETETSKTATKEQDKVTAEVTTETTALNAENRDGNETHDNKDDKKDETTTAVSEDKDKDKSNSTCDNDTDKVESNNGTTKDTSTDQTAVDAQVVKNETKPETKNNDDNTTAAEDSGVATTTTTENTTVPPSDAKTANSAVDTTAVEATNSTTVAAPETTAATAPTIGTETTDPAASNTTEVITTATTVAPPATSITPSETQQQLVPSGVPTGVPGLAPLRVPTGVPGVPNIPGQPQLATTTNQKPAPQAAPEGIIIEKAELEPNNVGKVIGKGGEQIRDIQARSGCQVDVDQKVPAGAPRVLTFQGTRKTVDFAKELIALLCSQGKDVELPLGEAKKKELHVPSSMIGKIIGRAGEMVRVRICLLYVALFVWLW